MKEYKPDKPQSNKLRSHSPTKAAECPKCHEVFTAPTLADKHLKRVSWVVDTYRMVCQNPADIGMELNKSGYWTFPTDDESEWWKKDE